jgi:shikimate dehydrogenase
LVLGNGGAAATAVTVLTDMGAEVVLLGRNDRVVGGISSEPYETVYVRHPDAEVVVNCTPVGMYPKLVGQSPVELGRLPKVKAVFDMIYNPARTALLQEADRLGIPAYNGLLMLVAQAKRASELFMGEVQEDSRIDEIVADIALETGNIVLVGMPGSGKSTVGKALAEALGRPLVDTDALIVNAAGRAIPDVFASEGEEYFRALETEAVKKAGMMSGAVIVTGGGVVTRERNYAPLSQNGRIVFIHRDLDKLPVNGRPISQTNPLEELYAKRLPLYKAFADLEIDNNGSITDTVETILKTLGFKT